MMNMIKLATVLTIMLFSFNTYARNSGENAQYCVHASSANGKVKFSNNCGEKVFIFWCGDLKYSKKKCGDNGNFYNMGHNIEEDGEYTIDVDGTYRWGACKGSKSFGHDEFEDYSGGRYRCLPG